VKVPAAKLHLKRAGMMAFDQGNAPGRELNLSRTPATKIHRFHSFIFHIAQSDKFYSTRFIPVLKIPKHIIRIYCPIVKLDIAYTTKTKGARLGIIETHLPDHANPFATSTPET
jgi:hypothetical protein